MGERNSRRHNTVLQVVAHEGFAACGLPLGVKLAPYFDGPHYDQAAGIINRHKDRIRYVVTMNTIGCAPY